MKHVLNMLLCGMMILVITGCGNKLDALRGDWLADIENQIQLTMNENGDTFGGKNTYDLECDDRGNYTLKLNENYAVTGTYEILDDNSITFKDKDGFLVGLCELSSDKEINCNQHATYAIKYIKKD